MRTSSLTLGLKLPCKCEPGLQMTARLQKQRSPFSDWGLAICPRSLRFNLLLHEARSSRRSGLLLFGGRIPGGVESRTGDILKQNAQRHRRRCLWKTDSGGRQGCDRCWPCRGHLSFSLYAILFTDTCIPHTTEAAAIHAFPCIRYATVISRLNLFLSLRLFSLLCVPFVYQNMQCSRPPYEPPIHTG